MIPGVSSIGNNETHSTMNKTILKYPSNKSKVGVRAKRSLDRGLTERVKSFYNPCSKEKIPPLFFEDPFKFDTYTPFGLKIKKDLV